MTYTLNRTPSKRGSVQFTYHFEPSENLTEYTAVLARGQTVLDSTNFTQTDDRLWTWNDSTTDGTLVVRADADSSGSFGQNHADVGEWAFVDWESYHISYYYYTYTGGKQPRLERTFQFERNGIVSGEYGYGYFGDYTLSTLEGLVEFRFVDPDSTIQASNKQQVLARLDAIARWFDVGQMRSPIYVFAPGDPIRGGGQARDDEFWANSDSELANSYYGSIYYHEYVHNRQTFSNSGGVYGTNMYWLIEGSAEYYQQYFAYRFGDMTADRLYEAVVSTGEDRSAVLADVRSDNPGPAYTKGAHVAAALDMRIRQVTNGRNTLQDVLRRLNSKTKTTGDERVNLSQFKALTEAEIGTSLDSWLERYVNSSSIPTIPRDLENHLTTDRGVPTAEAGANVTVREGQTVTLEGRESHDPNFEPLEYSWTQIVGPDVSLGGADTPTPTITAPVVDTDTDLVFELTVDDGDTTDTDTITVTVTPLNSPPTADAGENLTVPEGGSVELNATRSSDPDGDSLSYSWEQIAGPDVSVGDQDTATPTITAPAVDRQKQVVFEVTVADENASDTDTVTVTVTPDSPPPLPQRDTPPRDVDDDGVYEDLDADGELTLSDVQLYYQELFQNRDTQYVQNYLRFFDTDGDGEITLIDVQAVFEKRTDG